MYAGAPIAILGTSVAFRRGGSRVISRALLFVAALEVAYLFAFTLLGVWASGMGFFSTLFGLR